MEKNNITVEKVLSEGYKLDFGFVFEKSFENFKKIWGISGLSLLIVGVSLFILIFGILGAIYGFSNYTETLTGLNPEFMTSSSLIGLIFGTVLFSGLTGPINAGLIKMAHLANTNKHFGINTTFEYFSSIYFKDLFIASASIALVGSGIGSILDYIGIKYISTIISIVVSIFTLLTVPLIIFSNLKAFEAIGISIKLVAKHPFIIVGLLMVSILLVLLGFFALCFGVIFTLPFLYSFYYTLYITILPSESKDEIDEIGIY